jgi:hypothetical protein
MERTAQEHSREHNKEHNKETDRDSTRTEHNKERTEITAPNKRRLSVSTPLIPAKDGITAVTVIYCYGNYDVT